MGLLGGPRQGGPLRGSKTGWASKGVQDRVCLLGGPRQGVPLRGASKGVQDRVGL